MVQLKNKVIPICLQRTRIWSTKRQSEHTYIYKTEPKKTKKRRSYSIFEVFQVVEIFPKNMSTYCRHSMYNFYTGQQRLINCKKNRSSLAIECVILTSLFEPLIVVMGFMIPSKVNCVKWLEVQSTKCLWKQPDFRRTLGDCLIACCRFWNLTYDMNIIWENWTVFKKKKKEMFYPMTISGAKEKARKVLVQFHFEKAHK